MIEWEKRWPNFSPYEVLSPRGYAAHSINNTLLIQPHALDFLQSFRNYLGKPFIINHGNQQLRGYRDCGENIEAGGAFHSYHIQGLAFDVTIRDIEPERLFELAKDYRWRGVGLYNTFVHMDLRPRLDNSIVTWVRRD